ncbi:hypothetical protein KKC88_03740 [Patescibacteria group bacterium]|nr:hypothetical protein [Patescibacteria group bacterium]MBU1673375.1 hypothetical protein [Patescibacteria group bacterium]MBU1963457.1 hypothetical protein [Patescibacteria group bacterium]
MARSDQLTVDKLEFGDHFVFLAHAPDPCLEGIVCSRGSVNTGTYVLVSNGDSNFSALVFARVKKVSMSAPLGSSYDLEEDD